MFNEKTRRDKDSFYYCQGGESSPTLIDPWRLPGWVERGMLLDIDGGSFLGEMRQIGPKTPQNRPTGLRTTTVLVTTIGDDRSFFEGLVGEDLYRFSGKMVIKQLKEDG